MLEASCDPFHRYRHHPRATQNVPGIGADARRLIVARGVRSFAYSMLAVVLAVTLSDAGFSTPAIGALVSVSLAGDLCGT